jgi:membrane-associated phospholipid phosphatase
MALAGSAAAPSVLDRGTLAYLLFAAAVMTARGGASALPVVAVHLLLAVTAAAAPRLRAAGGLAAFLGEFYPLVAVAGLYTSIGLLNTAVGVSYDRTVQGWEQALFGGQPSYEWIRAQPCPVLSEVLHAGYLSYYLILAGAPLGLWASGRRDGARRVLTVMMLTFYVCYVVFLLFPVGGPRYEFPLAVNAATGAVAARATRHLLENGAAWGTAFPSSHVAVSVAASVATLLEWRPLGAALAVLAALLSLGTVYGQFHYAVDAVAGGILGLAMVAASRRASR